MIKQEYKKRDGSAGEIYKPEDKDEIVCNAQSVYESPPKDIIVNRGTSKERIVKGVKSYGISASWNGKDVFVKMTQGQKKYLDKVGDLTGKTIVFESYDNKVYGGKNLGVKIKLEAINR